MLVNDPFLSSDEVEQYLNKIKKSTEKEMKYFRTKPEERESWGDVRSRCLISNQLKLEKRLQLHQRKSMKM